MKNYVSALFICLVSLSCSTVQKGNFYKQTASERAISESVGTKWIVSTQGRAASAAVQEIYEKNGNIIDAAVAASFAISVERPQSTGIGGGGFLIYHEAKTGKDYAIDFRERAPKSAYTKMFLDRHGNVQKDKSITGKFAVAVPGLVKGLAEIHKKFGKLKFNELVQPAVRLAQNGVKVYPYLADTLVAQESTLKQFRNSKSIFLKANGQVYKLGETLVQNNLAKSLLKVGESYGEDFYSGSIAKEIAKATEGQITLKDLKNYKVKWREPLRGHYKGFEIVSMPPPSSGGAHVIEILNLLENENLAADGFQSTTGLLKISKAMQFAFLDRARYMGDPDFVKVPISTLISKDYSEAVRKTQLWQQQHVDAASIDNLWPVLKESTDTTHFSIMDADGNTVVSTQTINGWFGSGLVAGSTGILLNNEMDDFSAKPGDSNLFGAVGSVANSVQPEKTPLSSMSPTIIFKDGKPVLALGAPGGTRIISCVASVILNRLEYNLSLYDSVAALRIHQQWKPDDLKMEEGFDIEKIKEIENAGWKVKTGKAGCAVMAVSRENNQLRGVSEPRDYGQALGN